MRSVALIRVIVRKTIEHFDVFWIRIMIEIIKKKIKFSVFNELVTVLKFVLVIFL